MKRKDKYTAEQITKMFLPMIEEIDCNCCYLYDFCSVDWKQCKSCEEQIDKWLNEEIETKPLIATINTVEQLQSVASDFNKLCDTGHCSSCKYWTEEYTTQEDCFIRFLSEEVEMIE